MPAPDPQARPRPRTAASGVSMRELLASCAAAAAVSRPPRAPQPPAATHDHRRAA